MQISHTFVSAKADSSDATLIQPSNWNDDHTIVDASNTFVIPDYDFTAQVASGASLAVGSNSITLNPIPEGIAIGNYLYISGGTGTAESVIITGWNSATGVVIVTCGFTHSGAWSIQSASDGTQEALSACNDAGGGTVIGPAGSYTIRATVNLYNGIHLTGAGHYSTYFLKTLDFGDTFYALNKNTLRFSAFQVQQTINYVAGTPGTASNLPTVGAHFNLTGVNTADFNCVRFQDGFKNVSITGGSLLHFTQCQFAGTYDGRASSPKATYANFMLEQYNATYGIPTYIKLYGCEFFGNLNGTAVTTSNYNGVSGAYGIVIYCVEDFEMVGGSIGGMNVAGFLIESKTGHLIISNVRIRGVKFDSAAQQDIQIFADGTYTATLIDISNNIFNGEVAGHSAIYVRNSTAGVYTVYGLNISNNLFMGYYDSALQIEDGNGLTISGNTIYYYNNAGNVATSTSSGIYIGGRCTSFLITGNMVGGGQLFGLYDGAGNKCYFGICVASFGVTNLGTISGNNAPFAAAINTQSDLVFLNKSNSSTFANLPPTPPVGSYATVSDSNTSTWGANIAGGGANKVFAFYNGTNWTVAGK